MSIGKIIKTGLAIYGGAVLAKKLGRYIFVKNKDKIAAKIREKIVEGCDKAIDDIFHGDEKEIPIVKPFAYHTSDVLFSSADEAYTGRQKMIDRIHEYGFATFADLHSVAKIVNKDPNAENYGWTDPDIFERAIVERVKHTSIYSEYAYYIETDPPERLV